MCGRRGVAPYDHRSQTQTSRAPMRCYASADRHTQAMRPPALGRDGPVAIRVGTAVPIGAAAAVAAGARGVAVRPGGGLDRRCGSVFGADVGVLSRMDEQRTASHATREDPIRVATDVIVLAASVASRARVGYLLVAGSAKGV
jgi:hypothetical protein